MKNFVLISLLAVILTACKDPNIGSEDKTTTELLIAHGWQLDKFTNMQGVTLVDGQLNPSALRLFDLAFDFSINSRNRKEVRGIAKSSKGIINSGEWALKDDDKTLDIDITGFSGDFEIVQINNTTMILNAKTGRELPGLGPEILLVFSEFRL